MNRSASMLLPGPSGVLNRIGISSGISARARLKSPAVSTAGLVLELLLDLGHDQLHSLSVVTTHRDYVLQSLQQTCNTYTSASTHFFAIPGAAPHAGRGRLPLAGSVRGSRRRRADLMTGAVTAHSITPRNAGDVASVDAATLSNAKVDRMLMKISTIWSVSTIDDTLGNVVTVADGVEVSVGFLVVSLPEVSARSDLASASAVARASGSQRGGHELKYVLTFKKFKRCCGASRPGLPYHLPQRTARSSAGSVRFVWPSLGSLSAPPAARDAELG